MGSFKQWRWLWLVVGVLLVWLVVRQVSWTAVWGALRQLRLWEIGVLAVLNGLMLWALFGRWWLLLRGLGHQIPFWRVAQYGLAGFAVSYFTPGPHFGGEPLQVYLLKRHHGVPTTAAAASVTLDKALGLLINFTFLLVGSVVVFRGGLIAVAPDGRLVLWALLPVLLPLGLLVAWRLGRRPLSWLARPFGRLQAAVQPTERQITRFCTERPAELWLALAVSLLSWFWYMVEYLTMAYFLGLRLSLLQGITLIAASRVALLLPMPGALGTLEASQVWALGAMGLAAAPGLSLSLLIRTRDVALGLLGLWWGALPAEVEI